MIENNAKPVTSVEWLKSGGNAFAMGRMLAVVEYWHGYQAANGIHDTVSRLLSVPAAEFGFPSDEPDYWQNFVNGINEGRNEIRRGEVAAP